VVAFFYCGIFAERLSGSSPTHEWFSAAFAITNGSNAPADDGACVAR